MPQSRQVEANRQKMGDIVKTKERFGRGEQGSKIAADFD